MAVRDAEFLQFSHRCNVQLLLLLLYVVRTCSFTTIFSVVSTNLARPLLLSVVSTDTALCSYLPVTVSQYCAHLVAFGSAWSVLLHSFTIASSILFLGI